MRMMAKVMGNVLGIESGPSVPRALGPPGGISSAGGAYGGNSLRPRSPSPTPIPSKAPRLYEISDSPTAEELLQRGAHDKRRRSKATTAGIHGEAGHGLALGGYAGSGSAQDDLHDLMTRLLVVSNQHKSQVGGDHAVGRARGGGGSGSGSPGDAFASPVAVGRSGDEDEDDGMPMSPLGSIPSSVMGDDSLFEAGGDAWVAGGLGGGASPVAAHGLGRQDSIHSVGGLSWDSFLGESAMNGMMNGASGITPDADLLHDGGASPGWPPPSPAAGDFDPGLGAVPHARR